MKSVIILDFPCCGGKLRQHELRPQARNKIGVEFLQLICNDLLEWATLKIGMNSLAEVPEVIARSTTDLAPYGFNLFAVLIFLSRDVVGIEIFQKLFDV